MTNILHDQRRNPRGFAEDFAKPLVERAPRVKKLANRLRTTRELSAPLDRRWLTHPEARARAVAALRTVDQQPHPAARNFWRAGAKNSNKRWQCSWT